MFLYVPELQHLVKDVALGLCQLRPATRPAPMWTILKVPDDVGCRGTSCPPYGLPKKTLQSVFFCAQTIGFDGFYWG